MSYSEACNTLNDLYEELDMLYEELENCERYEDRIDCEVRIKEMKVVIDQIEFIFTNFI